MASSFVRDLPPKSTMPLKTNTVSNFGARHMELGGVILYRVKLNCVKLVYDPIWTFF